MCIHADAIRQFVDYFRGQEAAIAAVQPILFRKLLYVAALDPIARAAFGTADGHRGRNVRLIDELTAWPDRHRVSLPQLCLALESGDHASSALYVAAMERLKTWCSGGIIPLSKSPFLFELEPLANALERPILESCRYAGLFYSYRNNLVHEFREPGYGIEMSRDKDQPYYHGMIESPWQLVFPVGFFARLYADALLGLEEFLMRSDIDPYSQFEFGSQWRSK